MATLIYTRNGRWLTSSFFLLVALAALFFAFGNSGTQVATAQSLAAPIYVNGSFTFSTPLELARPLINTPFFLDQSVEPEIKTDLWGNIYITGIHGVPGGVDLWKSINKGTSFVYLGEPDGAEDKCGLPSLPTCNAGLGGGDDSIDVSTGGYLYVSSLWAGNVTMSTSYDGGTGGVLPGQKWEVHPGAAGLPSDDRQWVAAYGPQTLNMTYNATALTDPPGGFGLFFTKSTDAGKTFSTPAQIVGGPNSLNAVNVEGNLVVDPYNGNLYTAFIPNPGDNIINLAASTDGGTTWRITTAYTGPGGTTNRGVFPILAVDRGGNLHLAFTKSKANDQTNCHVFLTSTSNPAAVSPTWTTAVQVDSGSGNVSACLPWIVGGSSGIVDITWVGSTAASPSTINSNWSVFFAQVTSALTASPTIAQTQVSNTIVHNHSICFNGLGCAGASSPNADPGNRDLAEYYTMTIDGDGNANIAYEDSVNGSCGTETDSLGNPNCTSRPWYTKQTTGPSAYAPPAGPAAVTFGPNIQLPNSLNNSGEPSVAVDSHNCIYGSALGATFWASEDAGYTFRRGPEPNALGGGDEDLVTINKMNGSRDDAIYYGDLLLADIDVFKSTDRGNTWSGNATVYGHLNASSDRQWFAADRINSNANQIVWEMDHELASEDIRVAASIDDSAWGTTSGVVDAELATTIPNTNPGPVFVNKTTHEALGVFLASTITTNTADPPFGKEPNVWDFIASAPAAAMGPPQNVANYPIFKGVIDSPVTAPPGSTTYGSHAAAIFPSADADSAGNVYAVWSMISARPNTTIGANPATTWDILFASSHDGGKTFYGPFKVSSGTGTSVFPWIAAGDAGKVDIVWYQSSNPTPPLVSDPTSPAELTGGPNEMPAGSAWNVMFAQSLNANTREPSFTTVQVSTDPNHRGNISIGGTTGSSDRSLADYFNVYVGPDGLANIMYTDNANATGSEANHIAFVRQNGGPIALNNPSGVQCLGGAPIPIRVVSRKTHGAAGIFDVDLPLSPHGIECRVGQLSADQHKVVFTFPVPITTSGASITSGNGTVNGTTGSGTSTITVDFTASPGAQRVVVKLNAVNDGAGNAGDITWPIDILPGDTTADGSVNSADISQTKSRSGQVVGSTNFRSDVTLDGSLNSADISLVKSKSGTALP